MPLAATGGIGIRLLVAPQTSSDNPLSATYIVGVVAPGASIRRSVEIGNSTRNEVSVAVYSAAASIRRGNFDFAPGHRSNDLAHWTSLSSSRLRLPPGGKGRVTLTVRVPRIATSGEHYAVVWAELAAVATGGVRIVNRVGVRLYLTVSPGGTAPADFTIGRLRAARTATGAPFVHATLKNRSWRTLLIGGSLVLSRGPGGSSAGPFPTMPIDGLSPGGSAEVRVQLDRRLPDGPWTARLRLHGGQVERRAEARLSFPHLQGVRPASGTARNLLIIFVPFGILLTAGLAVLVTTGRLRFRRV